MQTKMIVSALACGATRVATLQISNTDSGVRVPGIATARGVHEAQHSGSHEDRVAIGAFFVKQMAKLVMALRDVTYPDGETLLDRTLVVMGSDMAIGTHAPNPAAFFVAGGGGAAVPLGRYLDVSATQPRHTQLLTSVAQALGMTDLGTIGHFPEDLAKGPLAGLLA